MKFITFSKSGSYAQINFLILLSQQLKTLFHCSLALR